MTVLMIITASNLGIGTKTTCVYNVRIATIDLYYVSRIHSLHPQPNVLDLFP